MKYFDGIKIGDKVWDIRYGWSEVVNIKCNLNKDYPLCVQFDNKYPVYQCIYNFNGIGMNTINQILFWDENKFNIHKKPKINLVKTKEDA